MSTLGQLAAAAVLLATLAALLRLGARLRARTRPDHVEIAHALMGAGMTAMYLPAGPPPIGWAVLFAVLALWLGVLALRARRPSYLHHVIGSLAMIYMTIAPRTGPTEHSALLVPTGHHHHANGPAMAVDAHAPGYALPLLAWLFALYCLLSAGFAGTDALRDRDRRKKLGAVVELVLSAAMAHMFLSTL